jgi:hypothetical protein
MISTSDPTEAVTAPGRSGGRDRGRVRIGQGTGSPGRRHPYLTTTSGS